MKLNIRELSTINSVVKRLDVEYQQGGADRIEFIMPHSIHDSPIANADKPVSLTCNVSLAYIDRYGEIEVEIRKN